MEQNLHDFFNSERFLKFKRNLKDIEHRKRLKQIQQENSQVHKQAYKDIKHIEKKIFNQMSISKSLYNQNK